MTPRYSDAVRARCRDTRRAGGWPEETRDIGTGATGSVASGAYTRLQVHVSAQRVVDDARFRVFGCSAAVASASYVADALIGVTADGPAAFDAEAIADALALPDDKRAMAALAAAAATGALDDWRAKAGLTEPSLESGRRR